MGQGLVHGSVRDPATSVGQVKVIRSRSLRAAGEGRVNVQIHKADPGVAHLGDHLPAGLQLPIQEACLLPGSSQPAQLRAAQMPLPWPLAPDRGSGWAKSSYLSPQLQQQHWHLR